MFIAIRIAEKMMAAKMQNVIMSNQLTKPQKRICDVQLFDRREKSKNYSSKCKLSAHDA